VELKELEGRFARGQLHVAASQAELETVLARIERGISLTSTLFVLVIAIAVAELFVANRTSSARGVQSEVKAFVSVPEGEGGR